MRKYRVTAEKYVNNRFVEITESIVEAVHCSVAAQMVDNGVNVFVVDVERV